VDEKTERSRGMTIELSNWFWEGVMMKGGVLSIDRAYFDITGGRERWLYRVARKHAGGAGEGGFAISMPVLFEKSGAEGQYRRFKFEMLKLAEKDDLPGYALSMETAKDGEPMIRMKRVDGKGEAEVSLPAAPKEERKNARSKAPRTPMNSLVEIANNHRAMTQPCAGRHHTMAMRTPPKLRARRRQQRRLGHGSISYFLFRRCFPGETRRSHRRPKAHPLHPCRPFRQGHARVHD
jgi:hypothetical protein